MKRLAVIFAVLLAIILTACQNPTPTPTLAPTSTPTPTPTTVPPTPTATPAPTATPTISPGAAAFTAYLDMLEAAAIGLSAETKACLMDLFEEDPSVAESFTKGEDLSGPSMLSFLACLTPEEAAALTPPGEGPPPDVAGLACLIGELEGVPEKDRILAVLSGADPSGAGLTLEESGALGGAVEACGIDTGFTFPGGEGGGRNPLAGTEWRLVLVLGSTLPPAEVMGGDPTTEFAATEMMGWTGCNSYHATYSVEESELRLEDLAWTEAGCPSQELLWQEQRIQESLATVEEFEISGERLTLHSEGGDALVFERVGN